MKIYLKNIGPMRQAELELGNLTIICGNNNTGKTYATYALYGFLAFWRNAFSIDISERSIKELLSEGTTKLDINMFVQEADKILEESCKAYSRELPKVFASSEKYFEESEFRVTVEKHDITPVPSFEQTIGSAKAQLFNITKQPDNSFIIISLLVDKKQANIPKQIVGRIIGNAVKEIIFGRIFPNHFIASAERTGAAIFRKELNFARNRLIEQMGSEKDINPFELINKVYSDYALPVKQNVDFTRQLEDVAKKESFIAKKYPNILSSFSDIIGGEYKVIRDELYFVPKARYGLRLTMDESSSAVRSLLDIGFYLRHIAQEGDLLMIDEPELNLHPENQRRVARLFACLVNIGIKIFITTHSDYMIKELNTLIMLNHDKPYLNKLRKDEKYQDQEMIKAINTKVYIAEESLMQLEGYSRRSRVLTLVLADIDNELGIEARSFDDTINDMNRIQDAILFGSED